MSVTVETLTKLEIRLPDKVTDGTGTDLSSWIGLAPFCATRYVKDEMFLVGDRTPGEKKRSETRRKNVDFEPAFCTSSPLGFVDQKFTKL